METRDFGEVYARYETLIRKFLNQFRYTDKYLQDDIIQDAFLILWMRREKSGEVENFEAYLFVIVRNLLIRELRKAGRHPVAAVEVEELVGISEDGAEGGDGGFGALERREMRRIYERGVYGLPRQTRTVVMLNESGMRVREIARTLGISPNTVRNHRQRAKKKLRLWLEGHVN